jgi:hypothetical protein
MNCRINANKLKYKEKTEEGGEREKKRIERKKKIIKEE